jgi:hypothetical protein
MEPMSLRILPAAFFLPAPAAPVRRGFIVVLLLMLIGVGGCAPMNAQYRDDYQFMTPKDGKVRACTAQCGGEGAAKATCWTRCGGKVIEQRACTANCSEFHLAPVETPTLKEE